MNFIKKYSTLLVPVVITLVALVVFVFVFLSRRALANDITDKSLSPHKQITSMLKNVPSASQAQEEALYQAQHAKDAENIARLARESTQRDLISYKIFPKPKGTSSQLFTEFGNDCRSSIEELVSGMRALDAPTDIEIENETGGDRRDGSVYRRTDDRQSALVDAICRRRAQEILVYANPSLFKWYDFWEDYEYAGAEQALQDCWYSQVAYWIYSDVVKTVTRLNEGSSSVLNSPVKRLLGVSFQEAVGYDVSNRRSSLSSGFIVADNPAYVMFGGAGPLKITPWTERVSNEDIDVVHFSVAVVLDSRAVMSFMKELCSAKTHQHRTGYLEDGEESTFIHNQITILQSDIESFDRKDEMHEYYFYGDCASIRLNLICEYIFNCKGYDEIKPEVIKELLGQAMEEEDSSKSKSQPKSKSPTKPKSQPKSKSSGSRRSTDTDIDSIL
jgi:hypothetical protein